MCRDLLLSKQLTMRRFYRKVRFTNFLTAQADINRIYPFGVIIGVNVAAARRGFTPAKAHGSKGKAARTTSSLYAGLTYI